MKPHRRQPTLPRHARGFTLVELMIAILIGLILVAAIISLFLGTRATYGYQEALSRVQENGRFATQLLARELRMAGFSGCNRNIFNWLNPSGTGYVTSIHGGQSVFGWEFTGTAPGDEYSLGGTAGSWNNSDGEALPGALTGSTITLHPGSDIFIINRAEPVDVTLSGNPGPPANTIHTLGSSTIPQGSIIIAVTSSCSGGDMWQKNNNHSSPSLPKGTGAPFNPGPGNINPDGGFRNEYDDNSQILRRMSVAYFVGVHPARGEPALYRRRLDPGGAHNSGAAFSHEELIEGVESMQALYGEDTNGNRQPDRYVTANAVDDWTRVVSVRIALLIRSTERAQTMSAVDDLVYNVGYARILPQQPGRVRQVFNVTVALRNRLP